MIEGGRIDHASHSNDTKKAIYELQEFMSVAEYLYTWASKDSSTILILTADHETGDLEVLESGNNEDEIPNVVWNSIQHTNKKVPLYICFDENVNMSNLVDNTDIFEYMNSL
jgi:alkaline phosphatase